MIFFLDFSKAFDTVDHTILLKKYLSMASGEMLCHGSRAIWKADVNLLLIMVYHLKLKYYNVEFLKAPLLDHFTF